MMKAPMVEVMDAAVALDAAETPAGRIEARGRLLRVFWPQIAAFMPHLRTPRRRAESPRLRRALDEPCLLDDARGREAAALVATQSGLALQMVKVAIVRAMLADDAGHSVGVDNDEVIVRFHAPLWNPYGSDYFAALRDVEDTARRIAFGHGVDVAVTSHSGGRFGYDQLGRPIPDALCIRLTLDEPFWIKVLDDEEAPNA